MLPALPGHAWVWLSMIRILFSRSLYRKFVLLLLNFTQAYYSSCSLPDATEMREIADKLNRDYSIPKCPLGVDGTMVRLGEKPLEEDLPQNTTRQDFWCRQVIKCDIQRSAKKIARGCEKFFTALAYLFCLASNSKITCHGHKMPFITGSSTIH